jgi:hypothetical protein
MLRDAGVVATPIKDGTEKVTPVADPDTESTSYNTLLRGTYKYLDDSSNANPYAAT